MKKKGNISVAVAIIVAGLIIGGAILFTQGNKNNPAVEKKTEEAEPSADIPSDISLSENIRPVDESDHIIGDINAPIKIVEFSDFECPFCGRVHPTIKQVVNDYDGKVAWVYRHLPLAQIHSNAEPLAQASECVAELGKENAFWDFADAIFTGKIDLETLDGIKEATGVEKETIQNCVNSGKYKQAIVEDAEEALALGGRGTPFAIILGPNDVALTLSGAQPIAAWKQVIDQMLAQ